MVRTFAERLSALALMGLGGLTGCQPMASQVPVIPLPSRDEEVSLFGPGNRAVDRHRYEPIVFAASRFDLASSEEEKIGRIAASVGAGERLLLGGFSTDEGSPEYCRVLSARRALVVRDALLRAGVTPAQIQVVGFGADWTENPERGCRVEIGVVQESRENPIAEDTAQSRTLEPR
jgi:OmpA family